MQIAGIEKNSFVDYPGKIAAVIFTRGCNMDCYYCHNRALLNKRKTEEDYDIQSVLHFLSKRRKLLDGVVISGGEPTLHRHLGSFIKEIKVLGYAVKLDTNGTNPKMLRQLIDMNLLDYVAMDIKAPINRYEEICCTSVELDSIEESIQLLMEDRVDYEFRTTFVPDLSEQDITMIADRIKGARHFVLQQFRRPPAEGEIVDYRNLKKPHSSYFFNEVSKRIRANVCQYETRGII